MALGRFSAMLIEECRDLTGLTYEEIDKKLGLETGQAFRWSRFGGPQSLSGIKKERSPQAGAMKYLEVKVAKFLGRPAHKLVVESNSHLDPNDPSKDLVVADLKPAINLRSYDQSDLQIGYEDNWPTYRRLKYSSKLDLIAVYRWQWRILWDPDDRKGLGDSEVDARIQELFEQAKQQRKSLLSESSDLRVGSLTCKK